MEEDYFGDVAAPSGAEEDDAANDVTFGNIGDIKAGDELSDIAWKPDHENLAAHVEAEKAAMMHRFQAPIPAPSTQAHPVYALPMAAQQQQLVAFHEQQARLLMQQQQQYAQLQMAAAKAAAERAGVSFDAAKFLDAQREQSAVFQRRVYDDFNNGLRMHQQQLHMQQLQQQNLMRVQQQRLQQQQQHAQVHVPEPLSAAAAISSEMNRPRPMRQEQSPSSSSPAMPPFPANASRLEEIERQMAAAGLGPSKANNTGSLASAKATSGPPSAVTEPLLAVAPLPKKRLESMTDKDLGLVLRMHLRHLDTSIPYKDDFYNSVSKQRAKSGSSELYADLAKTIRELNGDKSVHGRSSRGGPRGARIRTSRYGVEDDNDDSASNSSMAASHTTHNMSALANALGTLQAWNPKAPRKIVDFGTSDARSKVPEDGLKKSLRDDERVRVRQAVEQGYDILGSLHDIARRKRTGSTEPLLGKLFETLHLADKTLNSDENNSYAMESTRFFLRMCVFDKGQRYVVRVLDVLKPVEKVRVMTAVFEKLNVLLHMQPIARDGGGGKNFTDRTLLDAMVVAVEDKDLDARQCLEMLFAFSRTHSSDRAAFVRTLRSAVGAKIIYACMQRVYAGVTSGEIGSSEMQDAEMGVYCDALTMALGDVFDGAESTTDVWRVAAILDALALGDHQALLRTELKRLLEEGRAPPPPGA